MTPTDIQRPPYESVPLEIGRAWTGGGEFRYEEKIDGVWRVQEYTQPSGARCLIVGEFVRSPRAAGSWPGEFWAFDVVHYGGRDLRAWPLRSRLEVLGELATSWLQGQFRRPSTGVGGEFLEAVLARGGEGVVAKPLDAPFGTTWFKCKRQETFDLVVTEKHAGGRASIRLAAVERVGSSQRFKNPTSPETGVVATVQNSLSPGEDRGWCPCRREFDRVQVGDIVEVAAFGMTARGKLREPRFVRIRRDKMGSFL